MCELSGNPCSSTKAAPLPGKSRTYKLPRSRGTRCSVKARTPMSNSVHQRRRPPLWSLQHLRASPQTLLWGVFGTGVPIALAVLMFCEQHSARRWLVDLLGNPPQTITYPADVRSVRDCGSAIVTTHSRTPNAHPKALFRGRPATWN